MSCESFVMLHNSSWLKSGVICLHNRIWLITFPKFDGPARLSVINDEKWKIKCQKYYNFREERERQRISYSFVFSSSSSHSYELLIATNENEISYRWKSMMRSLIPQQDTQHIRTTKNSTNIISNVDLCITCWSESIENKLFIIISNGFSENCIRFWFYRSTVCTSYIYIYIYEGLIYLKWFFFSLIFYLFSWWVFIWSNLPISNQLMKCNNRFLEPITYMSRVHPTWICYTVSMYICEQK